MNELTSVVATLKGAVSALEGRQEPLTPLEKMKLKSLRLNLEAVQRAMPITVTTTARATQPPHHLISDPLDDKFRALHAISVKVNDEARALVQEVREHIARARALTIDLRTGLAHSERNCAELSAILRLN